MARFIKLPESLKSWKISSLISENNGCEVYKISNREFDGTVTNAKLTYVSLSKSAYDSENVEFINDEATFLKNLSQTSDMFNYIDVVVNNNPAKEKIELFIITEDLKTLSEVINAKSLNEAEIVDFGIQLSTILEKLEQDNIFHGNINTNNIFVTSDGKYKLGGFSDFEDKISDMTFVAPEIYKKENPDFTTDIYSLGLIMYYICNNNKIPFENDSTNKDSAIKQRFEGKSVSAPQNGNEKLKSVIVIACQSNNSNRWKNAGNIKNALTAIRNEIPVEKVTQNANVIVPETTDFEGNVFEEYEYDEFEETTPLVTETQTKEFTEKAVENSNNVESANNDVNIESEETEVIDLQEVETLPSPEIDFEVINPAEKVARTDNNDFEVIEIKKEDTNTYENTINSQNITVPPIIGIPSDDDKQNSNINESSFENFDVMDKPAKSRKPFAEKDYGDFFNEEESDKAKKEPIPAETNKNNDNSKEELIDIELAGNAFSDNDDASEKTSKNTIVILISIIIIIAALGFIAFCIINGKNKPNNNTETTQNTTQTTTENIIETTIPQTTAEPTTVEPTTVEPTTEATTEVNVIPVVGYGYSYGKKLLEQAGFVVETGEYKYSTEYDAGYIIAQYPDGDAVAEKGSVVTLDISLGLEEETTEAIEVSSNETSQSQTNGNYIFSNSNSSYISEADVNALNREDLNLALNEIYARRGRIFKDASLSAYFNSKSWYTPLYTSDEFSQKVTFNEYEQANLQLIINEQKERGYR